MHSHCLNESVLDGRNRLPAEVVCKSTLSGSKYVWNKHESDKKTKKIKNAESNQADLKD